MTIETVSLAETETLGRRIGGRLFPGAVVALNGPLGAGKTHLARAIAEGLDVKYPDQVTSPTFVLIQEYAARLPIFHFDAYRLKSVEEFEALGSAEYFAAGGVCLIEWAERVAEALPQERLDIAIAIVSPNRRRFQLRGHGLSHAAIVS